MRKLVIALGLLLIVSLVAGCSRVIIKSDSDPNVDLGTLRTFYVKKRPADDREIDKIIANKLNQLGFDAISGPKEQPSNAVDAVVTYEDEWIWDITMYMLEIKIELRDPATDYIFASGRSYRTSAAREEPEVMVEEVLRDIFAGKLY